MKELLVLYASIMVIIASSAIGFHNGKIKGREEATPRVASSTSYINGVEDFIKSIHMCIDFFQTSDIIKLDGCVANEIKTRFSYRESLGEFQ